MPLKSKAHLGKEVTEAGHRAPAGTVHPRLLVIEDDSRIREILHMLLGWEYEVVGMSSGGDDILEILDQYLPNLILMDVNLPGKDGFKLCELIRSSPRHRHIPVLFLTVRRDVDSFVKFVQANGNAFLNKPFEARELRRTIRRLLHD